MKEKIGAETPSSSGTEYGRRMMLKSEVKLALNPDALEIESIA